MKVRALHVAVALLGFGLGTTSALSAPIEANVPFEFLVGDKLLPPADYIIETASGSEPSVLLIKEKKSGERTMVDTEEISKKEDPRAISLIFDKVGDKVYLMEVWGVTDSGRGVKHMVDGRPLKAASDASRQRITAIHIVDGK